jgi:hypothetical protein
MFPRLPNPEWPPEIQVIFKNAQAEASLGCGGCVHAEWRGNLEYGKNGDEKEAVFDVSICRSGIPIHDGTPLLYCTAAQQTTENSNFAAHATSNRGLPTSTVIANLPQLAKLGRRP